MTQKRPKSEQSRQAAKDLGSLMLAVAALLAGLHSKAALAADLEPDQWAIHGQITNVTQRHTNFRAPYSGENSLRPRERTEETTDITMYVGRRLWQGAEFWFAPEIDQGFGLSNTVGVAGYVSGEAYKIGANRPYPRLPRVFLRQVIPLGGETQPIEPSLLQLAGRQTANNLTLTIGKFGVPDIFDTNRYAHDPRTDFMNWSVIESGAFDYGADPWGFTYGAAAELTKDWWTARAGLFQMSREPNGKVVRVDFRQYMLVGELEERHQWRGRPGKVKVLGFIDRARMARYRDAVNLTRQTTDTPDPSLVRAQRYKPGLALNLEQEVADDIGVFARLSANDGSKEAYDFTEINRSLATGVSVKGTGWGRAQDTLGVAGVINGLSRDGRDYFAAGGLGILIGDGRLNYAPEKIVEVYYSFALYRNLSLSLNYQHINNPAYNHDRGPVSVYGVRVHAEF